MFVCLFFGMVTELWTFLIGTFFLVIVLCHFWRQTDLKSILWLLKKKVDHNVIRFKPVWLVENRQLGVGSLLFLFPTPLLTPKPFGYKMLPIWLKDFCRVVSTPCASWVGGIFYFKIEKGAYFEGRGECCSLRWSFVVSPGGCCFSSPKHSTPASPSGVSFAWAIKRFTALL